jgi:hypothetical protein
VQDAALPAAWWLVSSGAAVAENPHVHRDYDIGYGRPPVHTQFRPGQAGNAAGRPKGSQGHATIVRRVALRWVSVGSGRARKRNIDLVLEAVRRGAAKGDSVALSLVRKYTGIVVNEEPMPRGILLTHGKLTDEEWEAEYGHLGQPKAADRLDQMVDGREPPSPMAGESS